jgi:hypothetical protein
LLVIPVPPSRIANPQAKGQYRVEDSYFCEEMIVGRPRQRFDKPPRCKMQLMLALKLHRSRMPTPSIKTTLRSFPFLLRGGKYGFGKGE